MKEHAADETDDEEAKPRSYRSNELRPTPCLRARRTSLNFQVGLGEDDTVLTEEVQAHLEIEDPSLSRDLEL